MSTTFGGRGVSARAGGMARATVNRARRERMGVSLRGLWSGVECGSALLCRFGFSCFSSLSLTTATDDRRETRAEARAAEQSTAALHTRPRPVTRRAGVVYDSRLVALVSQPKGRP